MCIGRKSREVFGLSLQIGRQTVATVHSEFRKLEKTKSGCRIPTEFSQKVGAAVCELQTSTARTIQNERQKWCRTSTFRLGFWNETPNLKGGGSFIFSGRPFAKLKPET